MRSLRMKVHIVNAYCSKSPLQTTMNMIIAISKSSDPKNHQGESIVHKTLSSLRINILHSTQQRILIQNLGFPRARKRPGDQAKVLY